MAPAVKSLVLPCISGIVIKDLSLCLVRTSFVCACHYSLSAYKNGIPHWNTKYKWMVLAMESPFCQCYKMSCASFLRRRAPLLLPTDTLPLEINFKRPSQSRDTCAKRNPKPNTCAYINNPRHVAQPRPSPPFTPTRVVIYPPSPGQFVENGVNTAARGREGWGASKFKFNAAVRVNVRASVARATDSTPWRRRDARRPDATLPRWRAGGGRVNTLAWHWQLRPSEGVPRGAVGGGESRRGRKRSWWADGAVDEGDDGRIRTTVGGLGGVY